MIKKIVAELKGLVRKGDAQIANPHATADMDRDKDFLDVYEQCKNYTMTGKERLYALYKAVEYVCLNNIKGDMVECGVWQGGSAKLMAITSKKFNSDRKIYLYDTFEGMTEPTEKDVDLFNHEARELMEGETWCYADLDGVRAVMSQSGYPADNIIFCKGKVEETIPATIPKHIAVLRLDTDWYNSTRHELTHLYPRLSKRGVLLIDDYGHWEGARLAVDQYFAELGTHVLLHRVDYTCRMVIK